jgi:hypothetical protein
MSLKIKLFSQPWKSNFSILTNYLNYNNLLYQDIFIINNLNIDKFISLICFLATRIRVKLFAKSA